MDNTILEKGITSYKSGEIEEAQKIFMSLVKQYPNNEYAWLWLSVCVQEKEQKEYCLRKVLQINPNNPSAIQELMKINSNDPKRNSLENKIISPRLENSIDHLLTLANTAKEAENYDEAYKYYSQVLEQDITISVAWLGKGISAGWLSSTKKQRIDEAITCISKGLEMSNGDAEIQKYVALHLIYISQAYTKIICEYLSNKYHDEISLNTNGVLIDPITAGLFIGAKRPAIAKKINEEFWNSYRPTITRASIYAWNLYPSIETASGLYNVITTVKGCSELGEHIQNGFEDGFKKTKAEIKNKIPKWKPPKTKKGWF